MTAKLKVPHLHVSAQVASLLLAVKSSPRRVRVVLGASATMLVVLSFCSALRLNPQGPFDARDYSRLSGMRLTQSSWAVLIEPLAAPLHIILGAPDFRLAFISTFIWVVVGCASLSGISDGWTNPRMSISARISRSLTRGYAAGMLMMMLIVFDVFARIPGWRLVVSDPQMLIMDTHSHTFASHDGFASAMENIDWHRAAGFNVVAITEHESASTTAGHSTGSPVLATIAGVELSCNAQGMHLVGLGLGSPYRLPLNGNAQYFPSRIISDIHDEKRGAVIAMGYNLEREDVIHLADAGIDGFEITNFGHPNIPDRIRATILTVAAQRGLVLVAASDWHGWGGMSRTWTVIRDSMNVGASPEQTANLAVRRLRERNTNRVIPVEAGYLGSPSTLRVLFAPFVETLRYAAELSCLRVASWWIWIIVVLTIAKRLHGLGLRPCKVLLAALLTVIGGTLLWAGWRLISMKGQYPGASAFPLHIGVYVLIPGTTALLVAAWQLINSRPGDVLPILQKE